MTCTNASEEFSAWIEVNRAALKHNLEEVRSILKSGTRLLCVVKANAYGHGVDGAAVLAESGADVLGVTTLDEALVLRGAGIRHPLLVFAPLLPATLDRAIECDLTATIGSFAEGAAISERASAAGRTARVHLKVDTGMGRLGVLPDSAADVARRVRRLPGVDLEGIYTHFGTASEREGSHRQFSRFQRVLQELEATGDRPAIAHCANSAAALRLPESHLDMVRVGTLLYGQYPMSSLSGRLKLRETWRLRARVVSVKELPAGWTVGYGAEMKLSRPARIAVLPVGYAEGVSLEVAARSRYSVLDRARRAAERLRGPSALKVRFGQRQAPVLGRISMQLTTVDISGIPDIAVGSIAEIPCRRVTSSARLPRVLVG